MGYTHYWRRPSDLPAPAFAAAVRDCLKVFAQSSVVLAGPNGHQRPRLHRSLIAFNGPWPTGHETFRVPLHERPRDGQLFVMEFCKTERRPYDLCVQAALIILAHHIGEAFAVGSDAEADWQVARQLCQRVLGFGGDFQLST